MTYAMDHEDRANRFLGAMECLQSLLAFSALDATVEREQLAQILSLLNDEARKVVTPFRMGANDDDDEPN